MKILLLRVKLIFFDITCYQGAPLAMMLKVKAIQNQGNIDE